MTAGIKVLFIGKSWDVPYDISVCEKVGGLFSHIAQFRPDVIVTSEFIPGALNVADFELRKRWVHIDQKADKKAVEGAVEACYANNLWGKHQFQEKNPLISVYTGSYNAGDFLRDTYQSLRDQTYPNWEWVVIDDESTDGTWEKLQEIAKEDHRVRSMRITHSGKIGHVKDIATRMADGEFLVELDHDDMLTDNALDEVKKAFQENPDVGMVYSNCAAFFQDGSPHQYTDGFWKDRYRDTEYKGKKYKECVNPDIYDRFGSGHYQQFGWFLTVGPNHVRAYRAQTLRELGGYNSQLPVADDWDVYARFFLRSKCLHIDKMLYLYRFLDGYQNTTFTRNQSIQDHLELGRHTYAAEFKQVNRDRQKLSVVVLDWNTPEVTGRCLHSLKKCYPNVEVVLVMNGEAKYEQHRHFKDVFDNWMADKALDVDINLGFAAGCNYGAIEASGEYLCFLNSDTVVEEGLLERLVDELADNPDVGVVGPYSNYAHPPQGHVQREEATVNRDVDMVSGFCMVIHRTLFEGLGGFDTQFETWEDDDLCRRIRNEGLKCRVVGGTWLHHEGHASFKANERDVDETQARNEALFGKKWPRVRVLALTYNEKAALPGFFEQFKGITDDFAILDSGSNDGTLAWAKEKGVQVKHHDFERFDRQRNKAIEMLGDGADWIVMFDPDERLDENTLKNFWELVRCEDYDVFWSPLRAQEYNGTDFTEWVPKPFLFRNLPELKWVFPVHEKLIGSHKQALVQNAMLTHVLELHDPAHRKNAQKGYENLVNEPHQDTEGFPVLDYDHRTDDKIREIWLGPGFL